MSFLTPGSSGSACAWARASVALSSASLLALSFVGATQELRTSMFVASPQPHSAGKEYLPLYRMLQPGKDRERSHRTRRLLQTRRHSYSFAHSLACFDWKALLCLQLHRHPRTKTSVPPGRPILGFGLSWLPHIPLLPQAAENRNPQDTVDKTDTQSVCVRLHPLRHRLHMYIQHLGLGVRSLLHPRPFDTTPTPFGFNL